MLALNSQTFADGSEGNCTQLRGVSYVPEFTLGSPFGGEATLTEYSKLRGVSNLTIPVPEAGSFASLCCAAYGHSSYSPFTCLLVACTQVLSKF